MPAGDCEGIDAYEATRAWRALWGLCLGTFVCFTNTTAFNIALPAISVSLGAGQVEQQWMVSAYNLVFGAFMLLAGSLGDRWGAKRTLLVGAGAFAAASAAGILATSAATTIVARGVMGFGAGFSITMTLALITRLFKSDRQVLALTMNAVAMTLGAPLGLVLGGLLVNFADWRAIFVFALAAFLIVLLQSPKSISYAVFCLKKTTPTPPPPPPPRPPNTPLPPPPPVPACPSCPRSSPSRDSPWSRRDSSTRRFPPLHRTRGA